MARMVSSISCPLLAQADHDPALGEQPRVLRAPQQLQRALEAGAGAHAAVQPRHRLGVVVQDVRAARRSPPASASQLPLKSGMSTSTAQPGDARADLADAGGEDARAAVLLVVAVHRGDDGVPQPHARDGVRDPAPAPRDRAAARGSPVLTAQKPHARVHTSPRIMKVAVPRFQHSPMFGQRASSHTVWSDEPAHQALRAPRSARPSARGP